MNKNSKHEMKGALAFATWIILTWLVISIAFAIAWVTGWDVIYIIAWWAMFGMLGTRVKIYRLQERLDEKENSDDKKILQ